MQLESRPWSPSAPDHRSEQQVATCYSISLYDSAAKANYFQLIGLLVLFSSRCWICRRDYDGILTSSAI